MPRNTDKTISTQIGATIEATRTALGLSRTALAEKLALSEVAVYNYESGKNYINVDLLFRVAAALDKPVETFLPGFFDRLDAGLFDDPEPEVEPAPADA